MADAHNSIIIQDVGISCSVCNRTIIVTCREKELLVLLVVILHILSPVFPLDAVLHNLTVKHDIIEDAVRCPTLLRTTLADNRPFMHMLLCQIVLVSE